MAPKKKDNVVPVFSQAEKAFYELQLADCNRKVARLRKTVDDYETRNEELQKAYDTIEVDRADVIAYLKKNFKIKNEENAELKDKVKGLEELREIETAELNETITELQKNFTRMKDQLTSENKLLAGKLNTLEEFRAIRENLMEKFDTQQQAFEDQELKYRRIIYDTETKFIIGKDKLKKEMEERLLQLAQQFQDASELRIAASTHRVIRENIALNNQLDNLLMTQAKVAEQNEKFKEDERASRCAMEVAEEERDKAMNKSIVQLKVIDQLTAAFEDVKKQKALYEKKLFDTEKMQAIIQKLTKDNENLVLHVRILEQNLHAILGDQNKTVVETAKLLRERETYRNILKESAFIVQASLKLDYWCTLDPSREILDREIVMKKILEVINQYRDAAPAESMESLVSLSKIYDKGDLGFEVKSVPSRRTQATSTGLSSTTSIQSFEDKRNVVPVPSTLPSTASMKTIPSIDILALDEEEPMPIQDSLASFVTSFHSSISEETEENDDDITDISKLLAISKVEMHKSLMENLAMSVISKRRISGLDSKSKLDIGSQKSLNAIHEKAAEKAGDNIEDEKHTVIPEEHESKPVQVHFDRESTQDTGEPVAVAQKDAEEDKKKKTNAE